jgi:hypothetical protein
VHNIPPCSPPFTPSHIPLPTVTNPRQDLFQLPVLCFGKAFFVCLRWLHREFPCDTCMYYVLNSFIPSLFLLSTLIPFFWSFQQA